MFGAFGLLWPSSQSLYGGGIIIQAPLVVLCSPAAWLEPEIVDLGFGRAPVDRNKPSQKDDTAAANAKDEIIPVRP